MERRSRELLTTNGDFALLRAGRLSSVPPGQVSRSVRWRSSRSLDTNRLAGAVLAVLNTVLWYYILVLAESIRLPSDDGRFGVCGDASPVR